MENTLRADRLFSYRKKLSKYKLDLQNVRALLPDYANLTTISETAIDEAKKLQLMEISLVRKADELEQLIADLETENDDQTPA